MAKAAAASTPTPPGTPKKGGKAEQPDPSQKSLAYQEMEAKWALIITLMGGTDMMRAAERTYLPQHAEESNGNYMERLNRCTLFNMFELTLDSLVGKPFVEPVKLNEGTIKEIADPDTGFAKNIDLQGNDLTSFCREWLRDAIAKGFSHVLVDMPKLSKEDQATRTLADDLKENRRPYWTLLRPENVLAAHSEIINGVEVLTHVRIIEQDVKLVGFAEIVTPRIRILEPGRWELWELHQVQDKKEPIWERIDEGESGLTYIPLVTFYANRTGYMLSKPPLEDLAHLNVRHWQSTSDQINVLTVARFPMLAVAGAQMTPGSQEQMAIGPRQLLATRDANGKFYYVEHSGKAIASGETDLEKLEDKMAAYGAEFLRRKIGGRTATERALDSSEAISPLKDITLRFMVSVNRCLDITADWISKPKGGTVLINTEFTEEDANTAAITTLGEARKRGDVSRFTWLNEMKRLEVLSSDLNTEDEMARIEHEAKTLFVKPTFVTASEQIRSVETITPGAGESPDQVATDILNDTPGAGDNKTQNTDGGTPGSTTPKPKPGPVNINHGPTKGAAKPAVTKAPKAT